MAGTILFACLYYWASLYYPGGSHYNTKEAGFSWLHNFWCNLLDERSINGQMNAARPMALAAMIVLCSSLIIFWWQFPNYASMGNRWKNSIRASGIIAMSTAFFLLSSLNHDLIINVASVFGLIATIGTLVGLFRNGWRLLFYFGLINLFLVVLNNVFYYNSDLIIYLPLVQKISFASFLVWIGSICVQQTKISISKG